jgi:hypothetical protein
MTRIAERSGVLVMRAWVEDGPRGLRVRITQSRGLAANDHVQTSASSVDEVLAVVRAWLELLLDAREPN